MAELVGPRVYSCCHCRNHVCLHDDIISKAFQGRNGRAFLFSHAMNISMGPKEDRQLMTGLHTVADIYCRDCREVLGWKYERAFEESQKYKEGKFIFEKAKISDAIHLGTLGRKSPISGGSFEIHVLQRLKYFK
uniref:Protein yippee-like n=1 Tax=Oryza glumipatula TaxID=40148 RepID=A0A0E0BK64_9ORYZ